MDNRTALYLAAIVIGIFVADALYFEWGLFTVLGRLLASFSEWLAFWR